MTTERFGISQDGLLYRINTATAEAALAGDTGLSDFGHGLAFAPNGTLHATSGSTLVTLDPTTGMQLASIPMTGPCIDGLAVRPSDGLLFGTACENDNSVWRIDPTTGVATFIGGSFELLPDTADLAFFRPVPAPAGAPAPVLSPTAIVMLVGLLAIVGLVRLANQRRSALR